MCKQHANAMVVSEFKLVFKTNSLVPLHGAAPWSSWSNEDHGPSIAKKVAELPLFEWSQVDFMIVSMGMDGSNGDGWFNRRRMESYMVEYGPTHRQLNFGSILKPVRFDPAPVRLNPSFHRSPSKVS
jgi:hypothetical protein